MSSLYKRANKHQRIALRIIEGAVLNTMDHHNMERDKRFARSIAKRAAGTLSDSKSYRAVLVGRSRRSEAKMRNLVDASGSEDVTRDTSSRSSQHCKANVGTSQLARRSPLLPILTKIGAMAGKARKSGDFEREAVLIECLKIIGNVYKEEKHA